MNHNGTANEHSHKSGFGGSSHGVLPSARRTLLIACMVGILGITTVTRHTFAAPGGFEINVVPIVGYEQVQQVIPTPRTVTRFFYGALVTAGVLLVSLEAEYTRGSHQESTLGISRNSTGERLKLGLRSSFGLSSLLSLYARGGVEAAQKTLEETIGGVTTTTYQPISYRPYAGLGTRARLSTKFSAIADVVAIFRDLSNLSLTEYQTTAGFAIRLP